jgi:nucleoside-triphosphatase THEP1
MRIEIIGDYDSGKSATALKINKLLKENGVTTTLKGVYEGNVHNDDSDLSQIDGVVEIIEKVETGIKIFNWIKRIFR